MTFQPGQSEYAPGRPCPAGRVTPIFIEAQSQGDALAIVRTARDLAEVGDMAAAHALLDGWLRDGYARTPASPRPTKAPRANPAHHLMIQRAIATDRAVEGLTANDSATSQSTVTTVLVHASTRERPITPAEQVS
jgi:hypothetical protein